MGYRLYSAAWCGKLQRKEGVRMLEVDVGSGEKVPAKVPAIVQCGNVVKERNLTAAKDWQEKWQAPVTTTRIHFGAIIVWEMVSWQKGCGGTGCFRRSVNGRVLKDQALEQSSEMLLRPIMTGL